MSESTCKIKKNTAKAICKLISWVEQMVSGHWRDIGHAAVTAASQGEFQAKNFQEDDMVTKKMKGGVTVKVAR